MDRFWRRSYVSMFSDLSSMQLLVISASFVGGSPTNAHGSAIFFACCDVVALQTLQNQISRGVWPPGCG